MENQPILDQETPNAPKSTYKKYFQYAEVFILSAIVLGAFGGSSGIIAFALLLLLLGYLIVPTLMFGSQGKAQHIFAHLAGLIPWVFFIGMVFKLESWEHANLWVYAATICSIIAWVYAIFQYRAAKETNPIDHFYLKIMVRLIFFSIIGAIVSIALQ